MVFSSMTFLTLFLPLVLMGYCVCFLPVFGKRWSGTNRVPANLFLLAASLLFYFWGEGWRIWVLAASCIGNFLLAWLMMWRVTTLEKQDEKNEYIFERTEKLNPDGPRTNFQKLLLVTAIVLNLAFLIYFKYFNFFIDNIADVLPPVWEINKWARVVLPLGISFFTFEAMSYVIDVYRGDVAAEKNIINFSCYLTMFQHLVAGPVIRYRDLYQQLTQRTLSRSQFASGVRRFIVGLSKKVLIANTVAVIADKAFELPPNQLTTATAWLGIVCYTLQIYYDFSAYSDMAIGMARMFGFEFLENFNYPYFARSAQDFWRRWHISLSSWFRDYLYIPLGGNRKGPWRIYLNLLFVFFLCGLWHGASWVFVAWGLYHGFFLALERLLTRDKKKIDGPNIGWKSLFSLFGHGYAVLMAMGGWVLFRSETFSHAWGYYGALIGNGEGGGGANAIWLYYALDVQIAIGAGILFSMPVLPALSRWWSRQLSHYTLSENPMSDVILLSMEMGRTVVLLGLLLLCFLPLASGTHNPFIYFRF
ncbi:MAG: MBOAT family protein [Deltaproteobacteria bacterium]|nr:MBOAT family protein [Deltaproteobacteria bacterium]